MTVLVHVVGRRVGIGGLNQRGIDLRITDINVRLPAVIRGSLAGVLCFRVIDGGEVIVTAFVINRNGRCFVIGGRVVPVKGCRYNLRIRRQIEAQIHQCGFLGLTAGLFRDGQTDQVAQIGLAATVDRCRHQRLACRVHHVVLVVHGERAVPGVNILQTVTGLQGEKTVAGNRQVQRVGRNRNIALTELLSDLLERNALTDHARGLLQRGGRKNVAEVGARTFKTGGTDVGDVVTRHGKLGRCRIQSG